MKREVVFAVLLAFGPFVASAESQQCDQMTVRWKGESPPRVKVRHKGVTSYYGNEFNERPTALSKPDKPDIFHETDMSMIAVVRNLMKRKNLWKTMKGDTVLVYNPDIPNPKRRTYRVVVRDNGPLAHDHKYNVWRSVDCPKSLFIAMYGDTVQGSGRVVILDNIPGFPSGTNLHNWLADNSQ